MTEMYIMREPCKWCLIHGVGEVIKGTILERNGQQVVRCARCERHCYNAPKKETGTPQRTVRTRPQLSFGQRERILQRDGAQCFLCKRNDGILHVAHVLSVADGREQGIEDEILFDDGNLITACEECNLGMGSISLQPRIWLALIWAQMKRKK